jgi:streptogramin lyase
MAIVATNQFPLPPAPGGDQPYALVTAPDGNIWFTANANQSGGTSQIPIGSIGEISPATGSITLFPLPFMIGAGGITLGPDGNIWFTEGTQIANINPTTHAITAYPVPNYVGNLVTGPDGNLWLTEDTVGKIAQFNVMTHAVSEFPLAKSSSEPYGITAGPDGKIWFTEAGDSQVGIINPTTKAISEFPTPTSMSDPISIVSGSDGNLWFTESNAGQIGTINPTTHAISEYTSGLPSGGEPQQIVSGPDGNLYYPTFVPTTSGNAHGIGVINPTTHATADYLGPGTLATNKAPQGITFGPAGDIWVAGFFEIDQAVIVPTDEASIQSLVQSDSIGNGNLSAPLPGMTVYLDLKGDGKLDPGDPTAVATSNGYYTFTGLDPGTYTVRVLTYPGQQLTGTAGASRSVTLIADEVASPAAFGVFSQSSLLPLPLNANPFGSENPECTAPG